MCKTTLVDGRSPPQELEGGPHSGPYLLVDFNTLDIQFGINILHSCGTQ